jgi:hypothetical protein
VPLEMLVSSGRIPHALAIGDGEKELLLRYWKNLKAVGGREYEWERLVQHYEIALVDWLRFQASWGFWGNTDWLEARVRHVVQDKVWREFLVRASTAG